MNDPQLIAPYYAHTYDPRVVESIARDTAAPMDSRLAYL